MILRLLLLPIRVPSWIGCRLSGGMALALDRGVEGAVVLAGRLRGGGGDAPSDRNQH